MRLPRIVRLLAIGAALAASAPSFAQASTPAECIAASERGQTKRDEGHLLASRVELTACAADACPAIVKRECLRWLAEVDERVPSLVISVKATSGKDVMGAEVMLDGVVVPNAMSGRPIPLDPGPHVVRAKLPGQEPIEEPIVARERERDRVLTLLARPAPTAAPVAPAPRERGGVPALSWVLGGVAVVGVGAFAALWSTGMGRVSDLRGSCAPYCTSGQIDDARVPLTTARIALGVGVAAALGAVTVYLLRPAATPPRTGSGALPLAFAF